MQIAPGVDEAGAVGGEAYVGGGTAILNGVTLTGNQAAGGYSGRGCGGAGTSGNGLGGGIHDDIGAAVNWDAITSITNDTAAMRGKKVYRP